MNAKFIAKGIAILTHRNISSHPRRRDACATKYRLCLCIDLKTQITDYGPSGTGTGTGRYYSGD